MSVLYGYGSAYVNVCVIRIWLCLCLCLCYTDMALPMSMSVLYGYGSACVYVCVIRIWLCLGMAQSVSMAVVCYTGMAQSVSMAVVCYTGMTQSVSMAVVCYCNERHSFHARVGRFSPFLYLRSVAIAVILLWLQLVVLVSPCFLGSRIPRDYRFPRAPLFLCSERKPS